MHYDLTLKQLFHERPTRLLHLLIGCRAVETLNVEFPAVKKRQPDLVMRLDDGRIYHLELQSSGDVAMPWRMLEYYALIRQHYGAPVLQQVLYVGQGPNTLVEGIEQDGLKYRYEVVDIRAIDCRALLTSPAIADNLLALLCRLHDEAEVVRTVLGRIARLDDNSRRDALHWLEILSGLRPIKSVIQREVEKMPITVNLRDNPFFQEAFAEGKQEGFQQGREEGREQGREQGRSEGEHRLLTKQLEKRFGPLPDPILERLKAAGSEQLEVWAVRLLNARSLDEVFSSGA